MINIINGRAIATDNYEITYRENGINELDFTISRDDPAFIEIAEQTQILETVHRAVYVVRKISTSRNQARIACQLDLDDWKSDIFINISALDNDGFSHTLNESAMLQYVINNSGSLSGWTVSSRIDTHKIRTISMAAPTPLEVVEQMSKTFGCALEFDNIGKNVSIFYPDEVKLGTAYAIETVNLREAPTYKGDSSNICTRIYPVGKDGLGIASVNGGKAYVDNTSYTGGKIMSAVWKDARYESASALLQDAREKLEKECVPVRSWQLTVADLYKIAPDEFAGLRFKMWDKLLLVDSATGARKTVQIREMRERPHYPESTKLTVSTATASVQKTIKSISAEITNANSQLWQKFTALFRQFRGG